VVPHTTSIESDILLDKFPRNWYVLNSVKVAVYCYDITIIHVDHVAFVFGI
jgi:hypothetical protein